MQDNNGIDKVRLLGLLSSETDNRFGRTLTNLDPTSVELEGGMNEFDMGLLPGTDVNEQRAALQSGWDHTLNGVGRATGRFVSEVAKMLPAAGGMLRYGAKESYNALMGEGWGNENFGEYINNAWVRSLEGISENINEELPVYVSDAVKNGNLWDNITSSSFWANEGADGLGFLASFFVPGAVMKSAGLIGKGTNTLGRIGELARKTGLGIKTAKNLEIGSVAAMNALFESGAEAANGYETILQELKHKEQERQRNWDPTNGEFVGKTEEELKSVAGEAAAGIFGTNMAILMFPNIMQAKMLFGSAKGTKIGKLFDNVVDPKTGKVATEALKQSPWKRVGGFLSAVGKASAAEGFWEEGMQFSAEKYFGNVAESGGKGAFGNIGGVFETYMQEIGGLDMQKGIFLGGVLGGGMSAINEATSGNRDFKRQRALVETLRKNYSSFSGSVDIFKKVKDANGVESFEMVNGRPVVDEVKLATVAKEMQEMDDLVAIKQASDLAGDFKGSNLVLREIASRFAMGYLADSKAGYTALLEHAKKVFEMNETPAEEQAIILKQFENLRNTYKNTDRFAQNLEFTRDPRTTTIEAVRDKIAQVLATLETRQQALTETRDEIAAEIAMMEQDTTLDKDTDSTYKNLQQSLSSYEGVIQDTKGKIDEIRKAKPDQLIVVVDAINQFEKLRNHVRDNKMEKAFDDAFDQAAKTLKEKEQSQPGATELDELTRQANQTKIDELTARGKEINLKMKEPNADIDALEREALTIADQMKALGISQVEYDNMVKAIKAVAAKKRESSLPPSGKLFHDLNTFTKLFHINDEHEENLKKILANKTEKEILANTIVRVSLNTYEKKETPPKNSSNTNFVVTSPTYNWEVIYMDGANEVRIGNLPEFNKFKLKDGRYLSELVKDPQVSETHLRAITGIPNLSKAELEKMVNAQENLYHVALAEIKSDPAKTIDVKINKDFKVVFHKGQYEYVPKGSVSESSVEDVMKNQPDGTEYVLVRIGKDKANSLPTTTPTYIGSKKGKGAAKEIADLNKLAVEHVKSTTGALQKSIGSYVLFMKQPSGSQYLVAVKSPIYADVTTALFEKITEASNKIKGLLSTTEKDSDGRWLMTDPDKAQKIADDINDKIKKELFIAYPQDDIEFQVSVNPKSGDVWLELASLKGKKGEKVNHTIRKFAPDPSKTFQQQFTEAVNSMKKDSANFSITTAELLDEFLKGINSMKVFRKAYPEKTKFTKENLAGFITSTSVDVVSGQGMSLTFTGKAPGVQAPPDAPDANNQVTKEEYERALKGLFFFTTPAMKALGITETTPEGILRQIGELLKAGVKGIDPDLLKHYDTVIRYKQGQNKLPVISKIYEEVKKKIIDFKNSPGRKLTVNPANQDQYIDENGVVYNRVTSLNPDKTDVTDPSFKNRGTIIDDLLRGFLEGSVVNLEQFLLTYNTHPLKVNAPVFETKALEDLWEIFNELKAHAEKSNIELITNLPTFWGELIVGGIPFNKVAGTVDVIGINRETGKVMIIDLKTSTQNRKDNKGRYFEEFKRSDEFQQNAYAELIAQRLGIDVQQLTTLPIQSMVGSTPNTISRFASNKSDGSMLMKVDRLVDKFKQKQSAPPPPPPPPPVDELAFLSWDGTGPVTDEMLVSAEAYRDFKTNDPKEKLKRIPNIKKAIAVIDARYAQDTASGKRPAALKLMDRKGERIDVIEAKKKLQKILPEGVSVEFLETFLERFPELSNAMGFYMNSSVYLLTSAQKGTEYHEAFHAVFRSVFPNETLAILYRNAQARYGKPSVEELIKDAEERDLYHYTLEERELLWYEEKMADDFQEFMNSRDSGFFTRFWKKLLSWLGFIATNQDTLEEVFKNISKGTYVSSSRVDNIFQNNPNQDVTAVRKLLVQGKERVNGVVELVMLNQQESDMIVNKIVYYANKEYNNAELRKGRTLEEIISQVVTDMENLYDEEFYIERMSSQMGDDAFALHYSDLVDRGLIGRMNRMHSALTQGENLSEIIDTVKYRLSLFSFKENLENEITDEIEDEKGTRFLKPETETIGGFDSLSKWMREYIGFTVMEEKDEFGNSELKEGMPMVRTLDVNKVYNGILRAASNQTDEQQFINRLRIYAQNNEEAGLFITKFFDDVGMGEDNIPTKNFRLYQGVVKQMSLFKVNYKFVRVNPDSNLDDNFKVSNANLHDIDIIQVEHWNNSYMASTDAEKESFLNNLKNAKVILQSQISRNEYETIQELEEAVDELYEYLNNDKVMNLSKGYVRFVVYSSLKEESEISKHTEVATMVNAFEGTELITVEDLDKIINEIEQGRPPFAYSTVVKQESIVSPEDQPDGVDQDFVEEESDQAEEVDDKTGAVTRARRMARGNSVFDETLGTTSFQNAEGQTVYAHQLPTYHLVAIASLKNPGKLESLTSDPFLKNNRILRSEKMRSAFLNGEFFRLDGTRAVQTDKKGKMNIFREQKTGVTFKHMTPREFMLSMVVLAHKKREGRKVPTVDENGAKGNMTMQSTLIRVLETSSTADFIDMPAVEDTFDAESMKVKNTVLREFLFRTKSEYERIAKVGAEIKAWDNGKGVRPAGGLIENYHTGGTKVTESGDLALISKESRSAGFRGIKFEKVEQLLFPATRNKLSALALQGVSFDEAMKQMGDIVKVEMAELVSAEYESYLEVLVEEGIITKEVDDKTKQVKFLNKMLPEAFGKEGFDLNLSKLADIFFTDWVNTIAINELLIGDEAIGLKNSIDAIKRAKGSNASGFDVSHGETSGEMPLPAFDKLALSVFKEPTEKLNLEGKEVEGKPTQIADAQGYMTIKAMKHVLHGLGKLTPEAARLLDKIERGDTIDKEDIFGGKVGDLNLVGSIKGDFQLNSMKLVYYDGQRYIKLSLVPLTKELTSIWHNGQWIPKPGMETLHNLHEEMDGYVDPNGKLNGVSVSVPESASKMMSVDVSTLGSMVFHDTNTKFWRLQLENPSNKKEITDPSQIIQLIDSELDPKEEVMFQGKPTIIKKIAESFRRDSAKVRENDFFQTAKTVVTQEDATKAFRESVRTGKVTPKMKQFLETAVATLSASGADSRLIEFFSPNERGEFNFNLNMPATLNKFSELFISYFSKNALKQKLPGYSVALMSGFGVEIMEEVGTGRIIRSEEYEADPDKFSKSVEPGKIQYKTRRLQHAKDRGDGIIYSEVLLPAHFAEFLNLDPTAPIPDEISYMFGIRIPSQDKHSAINLKVVGFLPTFMGSTAIFPHELIALSGADFDIDKMYIHRPAHFVDDQGKIRAYGDYKDVEYKNLEAYKFLEFMKYKLNEDKIFRKRFKNVLSDYIDKDIDVARLRNELGIVEKELRSIEEELDDTQYDLPIKFSGNLEDLKSAMGEDKKDALHKSLHEKRKKLSQTSKELKEKIDAYRAAAMNDTLKFFELPTTAEEFVGKEDLNNGVLYNRMLEAKMAMYSAKSAKAARQSPANLAAFEALKNSERMESLFSEDFNYKTDNLRGKYIANKSGREGAENIGLAVNGTLAFNVLAKMGAELAVEPSVAISRKRGSKGFKPKKFQYVNRDGVRVNDLLSNITTAMTDNAKELIAGKYGLSFEAIGVFTNMVALGYSFEEAILLVNQPVIRVYLENKRKKKSSIITKDEEAGSIRDFSDALKVAKSIGMEFESESETQADLSITEMVKAIKGSRPKSREVLSENTQRKAFALFKELEDQGTYIQNLNRIIKLVKGVDSNFESIDKVFEAVRSWEGDGNPFVSKKPLFDSNKLAESNYELLKMLDKISSKIFIERTRDFKSQMRAVVNGLKNQNPKDEVKKEIKNNLLSYYFLQAYKKILARDMKNNSWAKDTLSNSLIFDATNSDLREAYKKKNPDVTEQELDRLYPTITDLYNAARKEVTEYGRQNGNPNLKNAFLNYIVSKEATSSKNYHSLEARTRVRENPLFMEKIRDSFEELMLGKYGPEGQRFATAAFHYLMVKDGFQFKNASFINFLHNRRFKRFASTSHVNGSAVDIIQKLMTRDSMEVMEQIVMDEQGIPRVEKKVVDHYESFFGKGRNSMIMRFLRNVFAIHPENGYKIFFLRVPKRGGSPYKSAKNAETFGKLRKLRDKDGNFIEKKVAPVIERVIPERKGKNGEIIPETRYIEFNGLNELPGIRNDEKTASTAIENLLSLRTYKSKKNPESPYLFFGFRQYFKKGNEDGGYVYMLTDVLYKGKWQKLDPKFMKSDGTFVAIAARYKRVPMQGIRGVNNVLDADSGAPTYGQPFTVRLQKKFGKKKNSGRASSSQEIDDIMLFNMGIIPSLPQNDANTTDLSNLIPSDLPTSGNNPAEGVASEMDIDSIALGLAMSGGHREAIEQLLQSKGITVKGIVEFKSTIMSYLADLPESLGKSKDLNKVLGWLMKNKFC